MVYFTSRARSGNTPKRKQNRAESKSVSLVPHDSIEWVNATLLTRTRFTPHHSTMQNYRNKLKIFFYSSKNKPENLSVLGHMTFSFNSFLFYTWKKKTVLQIIPSSLPLAVVSTQLRLHSTLFYENPWWNAVCLPAALSVWPFEVLKQL